MKRKYYLRGIGVGILFATIVLLVAYIVTGREQMSDAEVIKRAEELGMVQAESVLDSLDKPADTEEDTGTENQASSENGSDEKSEENTEPSSEATTASTTEATSEEATEGTTSSGRVVTFTVVSGMNSYNVATILQDQGVIESADDFDAYLESNGYSARIATGEYSVSIGTDYETIAKMITGQ